MMICPACGRALTELAQSDLTVDVCDKGCGGIWFDNDELEKVDEAHESAGEALLDISPHKPIRSGHASTRACPRCGHVTMRRNYFSVRQEVEIDECPGCGGVWFDAGELASIRKQFKTEAERKQAAKEYFSRLFDKDLAAESARSHEEAQRVRKFSHALRFICPSYWIPGKQPGAAF